MTDPKTVSQPSDAEIEAVAKSLSITIGGDVSLFRRHARAALTAAAQVRAGTQLRPILAGSDVQDQCDELARRSPRDVNTEFVGFGNNVKPDAGYIQPTEPDQGEDVLGMRKGEGS